MKFCIALVAAKFGEMGECGFSQKVQVQLYKEIEKVTPHELAKSNISNLNYYCPNCCTELFWNDSKKRNECKNCGLSLCGGVTHSLREYHSHR